MRYLPYLYFLRVQLVCGILTALLAPMALYNWFNLRPLLEGLFDLTPWAAFWVSFLALVNSAGLAVTSGLVLRYGRERYEAEQIPDSFEVTFLTVLGLNISRRAVALMGVASIPGLILILGVICGPEGATGQWLRAVMSLLALGAFAACLAGVAFIYRGSSSRFTRWPARLVRWTPYGFLRRGENLAWVYPLELLSGHGLAMVMFGFTLAVYAMFAIGGYRALEYGSTAWYAPQIATLAALLFILMLVAWGLSFLAFVLDRYRLPIVGPVIVAWIFAAQFTESDHYYIAQPRQVTNRVPPTFALEQTSLEKPTDSAIVVTASGGGIQAAAWAARVLTGLVEAAADVADGAGNRGSFARHVRLMSSVSGGSVAALYFVGAYQNGDIDPHQAGRMILEPSKRSSLDGAAWGLAYPDLLRSVAPLAVSPRVDRGWALEQAWTRNETYLRGQMCAWRTDVLAGTRPAVIFNSTLVESGERLMISTIDRDSPNAGSRMFHELYGEYDISPATAARVSAAFPYVSPVARISQCVGRSRQFHLADGGYFDNSGVASAVETLDEAVPGNGVIKRVLLLQIKGEQQSQNRTPKQSRGWFFQSFAPLQTILNFWGAGQLSHNALEVSLLERLHRPAVTVEPVEFYYRRPEGRDYGPPLSWHLTERQAADIEAHWKSMTSGPQVEKVLNFLRNAKPRKAQP